MKTSEKTTGIVKALIQVQKEVKQVGKDRENPFASSTYATLDNILEEVKPKLNEHGILLSQEPHVHEQENGVTQVGVTTRLLHESGEWLEFEPLMMGLEKGSKMNMAQSAGSIITYAKRYSISAILGISTGDDTDGVHGQGQGNQQQGQPNQYQGQGKQQQANQYQQQGNQQQGPSRAQLDAELKAETQKYLNYLLQNGEEEAAINDWVAKREGVNRIEQVDPVRVMAQYKALAISKKNKIKEGQNQAPEQNQATEEKQPTGSPGTTQDDQTTLLQGNTTQPKKIEWGS